jgi:hypothetical protein
MQVNLICDRILFYLEEGRFETGRKRYFYLMIFSKNYNYSKRNEEDGPREGLER